MITGVKRMANNKKQAVAKSKKILFIGDIIGQVGRESVRKNLPKIKEKFEVDLVIANGEHLSERVGVDTEILFEMERIGVDFFTTGNHVWRKSEFKEEITKKNMPIVRPANFIHKYPGHGFRIIKTAIGRALIINLLGKEGIIEKVSNPFKKIDEILDTQKDYDFAIVDFHAEMSSEKVAMGFHLDGRVTAVVGTHTHVPTADAKILPNGTAFITDVGMTGPLNSVLGVKSEIIVERFLTGTGNKFEVADGPAVFNSVLITLDENYKVGSIKRLDKS
jgi:2',3'-cyclic-nucleotide 2'-phosphodiesterase